MSPRVITSKLILFFAFAFCGCNPLVNSPNTDSNFNPGLASGSQPTPAPAPIYADQTDGVSNQFSGGTANGLGWDSTNNFLRLTNAGGCDATQSNCNYDDELNSIWTPEWASVMGYWKLNEPTTSTFVTDSGPSGSHTGTLIGGVNLGATGRLNSAALLDGTTGKIQITGQLGTPSNVTLAGWVNYTSATDNEFISINNNVLIRLSASGVFGYFNSTTGGHSMQSSSSVSGLGWHYIAYTVDGVNNVHTLYVDGNSVSSATFTDSIAYPIGSGIGNTYIGAWGGGAANFLNGSADDVAIWSKALTAPQIQAIYVRQSLKHGGTFTSRVMDGLSSSANWTNFSWVPTLPFFKELPDNGVSETQANYSSQSANLMNGISALWHLDEVAGTSGAGSVIDHSGNGYNGTPHGNPTFGSAGILDSAVNFGSVGNQYIDLGTQSPVTGNSFSVSAWFTATTNTAGPGNTASAASNYVFAKGGDASANSYGFDVFNSSGTTYLLFMTYPVGSSVSWLGPAVTPNQWHHAVAVISGTSEKVYVDGVLASSATISGTFSASAQNLKIGGSDSDAGNHYWFENGSIGEVAVWSRVLGDGNNGTPNEILELYRRGANRIEYQLRTCAAEDCSDDTTNANWKGPDNSNQTYFSELNNTLANVANASVQASLPAMLFSNFLNLIIPSHEYFQYRAVMESDDTSTNCNYGAGPTWCSPELKSVTVGPGHSQ